MSVGDKDEAIRGFLKVDGRLHLLKERSIYEIKLADDIDPDRTNINIPNTQQKVLHYGTESEFIGRTLITAQELFKENYLPPEINVQHCVSLSFNAARELALMADAVAAYAAELNVSTNSLQDNRRKDRSVGLPSIQNLEPRFKEFVQRADDSLSSLFAIVRHVYKDFRKGGWDEFATLIETRHGTDDTFSHFLWGTDAS
jgi:hypothetical protein